VFAKASIERIFRRVGVSGKYVFMRIHAGNDASRRDHSVTGFAYIAVQKSRLPVDPSLGSAG
jgi:hypothetical protein